MRYRAQATNPLEWLAFKLGQVPLPILDTIVPLIQARSLMVANNTGVLRRLANQKERTEDLAKNLSLDAECLGLVLRVLQSMGYVSKTGGLWELTDLGRKHFGPQAKESYEAFAEYGPSQWEFIENLDEVLKTGKGIDFHNRQSSREWNAYQRAMLENARSFAWFIAKNTPVPEQPKSCLDIAGSHGFVGGVLCERYPTMRSTVLDRPEALATARHLGKNEPWHSKIQFKEGDLLKDDFGKGHDVVLLSNILHHFPAQTNIQILRKTKESLKPGGAVSIFEIETPHEDQKAEAAADSFALYFKITSTSACFRASDYQSWLKQAGFESSKVVRSVKMPSRMLVVATKCID